MLSLTGGFTDPARQSARAFRAALEAMARPGHIMQVAGAVPPAPLSVAAGTLLLVLADAETPVWLAPSHDRADVREWITFHAGAPFSAPAEATFAIGTWSGLCPLDRFAPGRPDYPDRAATLIVELPDLAAEGATLRGPGIKGTTQLSLPDIAAFRDNHALFPQGRDFFLTAGARLAGLPRSTIVEEA